MATAVLTCPLEPLRPATPPAPPSTAAAATATAAADRGPPAPVPNKHLPFCSPGPRPATRTCGPSRPASASPPPPPSPAPPRAVETSTLTHPPTGFDRVCHHPAVYAITADQLSHALDHLSSQPLPPPAHVFPWLHGLHADNQLQLAFFAARQKSPRRTPSGLRGIAVVKAGGDLSQCRIRGAVAPEELLRPVPPVENSRPAEEPQFWDADPPDGFSVRNFHIQTCKMAAVSDIVVYGDEKTPREEAARLAQSISNAQALWQQKTDGSRHHASRSFNTFLLSADWTTIECDYPDLVQVDSEGCATGKVTDFFHWERREMCSMSAPREIAPNVWMGPTPDPVLQAAAHGLRLSDHQQGFDILVECSDTAHIPDAHALQRVEGAVERRERSGTDRFERAALHIEFPGSGAIMPPTWSQAEVDGLLAMCQWIHKQAHRPSAARKRRDSKLSSLTPPLDADGDSIMQRREPRQAGRKLLIHCTDGYTETSLLGLAYYMYANCLPVHAAWVELHREKGRNFFAYSSDVHLLRALQPRILHASPKHTGHLHSLCTAGPEWLDKMDGSLPSRILPYMYLGNLGHANNPGLLKELDIGQILSVGEAVTWPREVMDEWPPENLMFIDQVQDNGVDPLTDEFGRCLEFIGKGRRKGIKTLVHCRVGVSRSATICIAEVMSELDLSLPRAYCFVRARRLNVIIQPHLRFAYELLKWEEVQCQKRGRPLRRELEWATIAREIAALNQPYSRQG